MRGRRAPIRGSVRRKDRSQASSVCPIARQRFISPTGFWRGSRRRGNRPGIHVDCYRSAHSVSGATPVFATSTGYWCVTVDSMKAASLLGPVHHRRRSVRCTPDMDANLGSCEASRIPVLEDAAQSIGAGLPRRSSRGAGAIWHVSAFTAPRL